MAGNSDPDYFEDSPDQAAITVAPKPQPRNSIGGDAKRDRTKYQVLRTRLKDTIESTIGREVFQRTGHPINYIKSDPDAPNGFQWVFSDNYTAFPHTALSDFRHDDIDECNAALDAGHLRVIQTVPSTEGSESESVAKGLLSREAMIRSVRENILRLIKEETGVLESVDDVPDILTQRSIIMDGLMWKLQNGFQFPFGGLNPKMNKLQFTNWSNVELEETLRAIDTGDLKLVRTNESVVQGDRVLRRKDRPRRSHVRDSIEGPILALFTGARPRRAVTTAGGSVTVDRDDDESGKGTEISLGLAKGDGDHEILKLLETQMLKRKMALHGAQEQNKRLQSLIDAKQTDIEARDVQIKQLEDQLQEATERAAQKLVAKQEARTNNERSHQNGGIEPCPTCTLDPTIIIDLQDSNRKNVDRIMDMIDRQRDLEKQLAAKIAEIELARQRGFDGGMQAEREGRKSAHAHPSLSHQRSSTDANGNGISPRYGSRVRIGDSEASSPDPTNNSSSSQTTVDVPARSPISTSRTAQGNGDIRRYASNQRSDGYQRQFIRQGHFSQEFLNHLAGGDEQMFSSLPDGTTLDKNVTGLEKLITINRRYQLQAPSGTGKNGIVFLVDGDPASSKSWGVHPTLVSSSDGSYSYIGNYDVASTDLVSLDQWKAWPANVQRSFAKTVLETSWGDKLLVEKNLLLQSNNEEGKIKEVVGFFGRASTPCLRMRSYSLRYAFYSKTDHQDIGSAWDIFNTQQTWAGKLLKEVPGSSDVVSSLSRDAMTWLKDGEKSDQSATKRKAMSEAPQQNANKRQREV